MLNFEILSNAIGPPLKPSKSSEQQKALSLTITISAFLVSSYEFSTLPNQSYSSKFRPQIICSPTSRIPRGCTGSLKRGELEGPAFQVGCNKCSAQYYDAFVAKELIHRGSNPLLYVLTMDQMEWLADQLFNLKSRCVLTEKENEVVWGLYLEFDRFLLEWMNRKSILNIVNINGTGWILPSASMWSI